MKRNATPPDGLKANKEPCNQIVWHWLCWFSWAGTAAFASKQRDPVWSREHHRGTPEVGNVKTTGLFNNACVSASRAEDLGGGLKAGFQLEKGFQLIPAHPLQLSSAVKAEVNLSGGFGTVRLGNFFPESYYATADYISMHNHDTGSFADALFYDPVWFRSPGSKNKG